MKYTAGALYMEKSGKLKTHTKTITLLNSKGTNKHLQLPDDYADYLLVVETYGAGVISKEKLRPFVVANGDSLVASIPIAELSMVYQCDNRTFTIDNPINIKQHILDFISRSIVSAVHPA